MKYLRPQDLQGLTLNQAFYEIKRVARSEAEDAMSMPINLHRVRGGTVWYKTDLGTLECFALLEDCTWTYCWSIVHPSGIGIVIKDMGIGLAKHYFKIYSK